MFLWNNGKPQDNLTSIVDPTVNAGESEGYSISSTWVNTFTKQVWKCVNATDGSAQWEPLTLKLYAQYFNSVGQNLNIPGGVDILFGNNVSIFNSDQYSVSHVGGTGTFTINTAGIYGFDFNINWTFASGVVTQTMALYLSIAGVLQQQSIRVGYVSSDRLAGGVHGEVSNIFIAPASVVKLIAFGVSGAGTNSTVLLSCHFNITLLKQL